MSDTEKKPLIYAVIPARGGSKGIPRKNIKDFAGKPLIAHTIDAVKGASLVSGIFCSTDDVEIAEVAKKYGAEIPFMRPSELAGDTTPSIDVMVHFAKTLRDTGMKVPEYMILLQATSPLRTAEHIDGALKFLMTPGTDSVIGVSLAEASNHPAWSFKEHEDGTLTLWDGTPVRDIVKRRQALPKAYRSNGMIFAFRTALLLSAQPSLYGDVCRGFEIDLKYAVDIDVPADWLIAEEKYKALHLQ